MQRCKNLGMEEGRAVYIARFVGEVEAKALASNKLDATFGEFSDTQLRPLQVEQNADGAPRFEFDLTNGAHPFGVVCLAAVAEIEAEDVRTCEKIALKLLPRRQRGNPALRERFQAEAEMYRRLSHPNVVGVHDQGEWDGLVFLVMEFVPGITCGIISSWKPVSTGEPLASCSDSCRPPAWPCSERAWA